VSSSAVLQRIALEARLVSAKQLEARERRARLPSGVAELDALIGGGWPRGALSELAGGRSSGRTALLLASIAEALRREEAVALVDVGGTLDVRAAQRTGVALSRLLWVRCTAEKALAAVELVLGAGGFGLVAVDLGETRTGTSAAWLRLKRGADQHGTVVLVAAARRPQGALGACAVTLTRRRARFGEHGAPALLQGLEARAAVDRGGDRGAEAPPLTFVHAVD
jgi:hypothetical protein